MKIVKNKKVETIIEEINIEQGTYYFSDDDNSIFYKVEFEEDIDGYITYDVVEVVNHYHKKSITVHSDGIWYGLPSRYENLFINGAKKTERESFNRIKLEVLDKL